MTNILNGVAPFPVETFRSYGEFAAYLAESDAKRGLRWLHERSLASTQKTVTLAGTCGLCMTPTTFTAATRGGEPAPNGLMPNWREELACGCEHRLINRRRALLHFLAAEGLLRPWTRILLMGEVSALQPFLSGVSDRVTPFLAPLTPDLAGLTAPRGGFHLILSVEQLTARLSMSDVFLNLQTLLAPGGRVVFTAPFDIRASGTVPTDEGPIGWNILNALTASRFADVRAVGYWSEEFGYLGAFSFIITGGIV